MYLLALMFGILLLPEASTLTCYECIPDDSETCNETIKECPKGQQCAAMRLVSYEGGLKVVENSKGCAVAKDCGEYSINYGFSKLKVTNRCCTTALCNTQLPPEPQSKPNGKQCYYCDGLTCTNILNCEGNEDYCFSITGSQGEVSATTKGCVSKQLCTGTTSSCCQGNLCNGASSCSAGLVLLAAPLLSLLVTSY
ncbi:hypothetical protein PFLUV_G00161270 [Perca fluviatilis]|uniref:UPAR/Ly6 domain-containing protein n=1 Tax=Perca fluviatilis TaxID=8168 RepID=A0A6A5F420_PERFL|nr:ly6/PLAUR domain-containing protein 3-like [Perca fluviatilis]KAF1382132.1 hypothetical protein PFLUV_G00161270 [Perca fluviatilis]